MRTDKAQVHIFTHETMYFLKHGKRNLVFQVKEDFQWRRERAMADRRMRRMRRTTPMKDPIKDPEIRSQKELNC